MYSHNGCSHVNDCHCHSRNLPVQFPIASYMLLSHQAVSSDKDRVSLSPLISSSSSSNALNKSKVMRSVGLHFCKLFN